MLIMITYLSFFDYKIKKEKLRKSIVNYEEEWTRDRLSFVTLVLIQFKPMFHFHTP